jgi:hypothetical protein
MLDQQDKAHREGRVEALRWYAGQLRDDGLVGRARALEAVAARVEAGGGYIERAPGSPVARETE